MKVLLGILTVLVLLTTVNAQQKDSEIVPGIQALGRAQTDRIIIRWAPNTPATWELANRYGYMVERLTITKDSMVVSPPLRKVLTVDPMMPWPLEQWQELADEDDHYVAIAAEALYNKEMEIEDTSTGLMQMINQATALETRFSFALFAADMSLPAAEASALTYTDVDIHPDERYLYRIYTTVPKQTMAIDTGYVYIGMADYHTLPAPQEISAQFEDKLALISWNRQRLEHYYNSYIVERSDDGGRTFQPISEDPIVNTYEGESPERMFKMDSLEQNLKRHVYRVKGHTPFGEIGPPSDTVSGYGRPVMAAVPHINKSEVINNRQVLINWEFPDSLNTIISGFSLLKADMANGDYKMVKDRISANLRSAKDLAPETTNYYVVEVYDAYGNRNRSYPTIAMLEDSIPPLKPSGLNGAIDTTGIVSLTWVPNSESDLLGYQVFRSNFLNAEYTRITPEPVRDPVFMDTIKLKTLTEQVHYKILAVDKRYNPSDMSKVLTLARPDIVPPVAPVFTEVKASKQGIALKWINSTSKDVRQHILYRKTGKNRHWDELVRLERAESKYFDDSSEPDINYTYTLIAVDKSQLESDPAKPVKSKRLFSAKDMPAPLISAVADRKKHLILLNWDYDKGNVMRYLIFRARGSEALRLYKVESSGNKVLEDKELQMDQFYTYRVQAEYSDGTRSNISEMVKVRY